MSNELIITVSTHLDAASRVTMKFLIFLSCLVAVQAGAVRKTCQGISVEGSYYQKELLLKNFDRPYLLDVNKLTNELYFSYSKDEDSTLATSVRYDLNTKHYYKIKDIESGNSHAVDQDTGDVYIGAYDGIYKYKPRRTPIEIMSDLNNWITDMFFKDGVLYFSTYPDGKMYTYSKDGLIQYSELDDSAVDYFVLNGSDVLFFSNDTGIYSRDAINTVQLMSVAKDAVRGLALDNNGRVYASLVDGVYVLDDEHSMMQKLFDLPSSFGVAFDRDNNMIYSTDTGLVRLLPLDTSECQYIYK